MDQRLSLVTLGVRDVAAAFYESVGFERRHDLGSTVFLPTTGTALALWGGHSGHVADPDGHLWEIAYNPAQALMRIDENGRLHLRTR